MSTYGTNQNESQSNNNHPNGISEEDGLLTGHKDSTTGTFFSYRLKPYLHANVTTKGADFILLYCYMITGLMDSSATAIWGCFVSMQTGNSIYLGLGIANPSPDQKYIKAFVSIVTFCIGSFCFTRFHRYFGQKKRWVLVANFSVQVLMVVSAAVFVTVTPDTKPGDEHAVHWHVLIPLAMVAFQSSGQAVTSRAVEHGPLTSVVLTSIYCDLFADAKLFAGLTQNAQRNRRAAAPVLLLIGAIFGGFFSKQGQIGIAGALWVGAGLKVLIVVAWLVWREAEEQEDDE